MTRFAQVQYENRGKVIYSAAIEIGSKTMSDLLFAGSRAIHKKHGVCVDAYKLSVSL